MGRIVLGWLQRLAESQCVHGWIATGIVINELARHLVVTLFLIASVHITAAFVEWIARATGSAIMTTGVVGPVQLKHLILAIDALLICRLAYEGFHDISEIYRKERARRRDDP